MKKTVTIGIPAYNEEANIKLLLQSLLAQKFEPRVKLLEITVISDGSIDKTVEVAKSVRHPLIKIIDSKNRLGQQVRQNQLTSLFKGDILIIIEADTLPSTNKTINTLVTPFLENKNSQLGMVNGQVVSLPTKTLVEKIDAQGMNIKHAIFSEWKKGDNVYVTGGHAMKALSRKFTEKLVWPSDVPEDSYTYFCLKQNGFEMKKQHNARVFVKRAGTLKDYIRRNEKFVRGRQILKTYFPDDLVDSEFNPPIKLVAKHLLLATFNSPLLTILYLIGSILVRILNSRVKEFDPLYQTFSSTKSLIPYKDGVL